MICLRCGRQLAWGQHPNSSATAFYWRDAAGSPTCVVGLSIAPHVVERVPNLADRAAVEMWLADV